MALINNNDDYRNFLAVAENFMGYNPDKYPKIARTLEHLVDTIEVYEKKRWPKLTIEIIRSKRRANTKGDTKDE